MRYEAQGRDLYAQLRDAEEVWLAPPSQVEITCQLCDGDSSPRDPKSCKRCDGRGVEGETYRCFICKGSGSILRMNDCPICSGIGTVTESQLDEVARG